MPIFEQAVRLQVRQPSVKNLQFGDARTIFCHQLSSADGVSPSGFCRSSRKSSDGVGAEAAGGWVAIGAGASSALGACARAASQTNRPPRTTMSASPAQRIATARRLQITFGNPQTQGRRSRSGVRAAQPQSNHKRNRPISGCWSKPASARFRPLLATCDASIRRFWYRRSTDARGHRRFLPQAPDGGP